MKEFPNETKYQNFDILFRAKQTSPQKLFWEG